MKHSVLTQRRLGAHLVCRLFAAVTLPAAAHPGHAWGQAGVLHLITSMDHALPLVLLGFFCALLAHRVERPTVRFALRGLASFAVLGALLELGLHSARWPQP